MTKIVPTDESSFSLRLMEHRLEDMTELASKTHIEVAKYQSERYTVPAKWASAALFGGLVVLVVGAVTAGVLLAPYDWKLAVGAVIAICGMGGYVMKGPLNKIIGAVADSIGQ